jgi:hypothetical protein
LALLGGRRCSARKRLKALMADIYSIEFEEMFVEG